MWLHVQTHSPTPNFKNKTKKKFEKQNKTKHFKYGKQLQHGCAKLKFNPTIIYWMLIVQQALGVSPRIG